ncbi:MAG: efflux RND transporter periplasmic adaptor subunit, partial [Proteobacteria bacterium]|nr:efflux RND transporter periplasmic adaptor subunit [Pseudomonadota bacterium]
MATNVTIITALSDGWVSERMVDPGQYVQRGQPLLSDDRLKKVRLRFDVAEQDLAMVRPGTEVVLEFPQIPRARFDDSRWKTRLLADYEDPVVRAEVTTVFPKLGEQSRLGVVEVLMPNPDL